MGEKSGEEKGREEINSNYAKAVSARRKVTARQTYMPHRATYACNCCRSSRVSTSNSSHSLETSMARTHSACAFATKPPPLPCGSERSSSNAHEGNSMGAPGAPSKLTRQMHALWFSAATPSLKVPSAERRPKASFSAASHFKEPLPAPPNSTAPLRAVSHPTAPAAHPIASPPATFSTPPPAASRPTVSAAPAPSRPAAPLAPCRIASP